MEQSEYDGCGGPELVGFRGSCTEAHQHTRSVGDNGCAAAVGHAAMAIAGEIGAETTVRVERQSIALAPALLATLEQVKRLNRRAVIASSVGRCSVAR